MIFRWGLKQLDRAAMVTPPAFLGASNTAADAAGFYCGNGGTVDIDVVVEGASGRRLPFRAKFFLPNGKTVEEESDAQGRLWYSDSDLPDPTSAYILPSVGGFWSIAVGPPWVDVEFVCPEIHPQQSHWWRTLMRLPSGQLRGSGIRIGVVDSSFKSVGLTGRVTTVALPIGPSFATDDTLAHGAQVCSVLVGNSSVHPDFEGACRGATVIHVPVGDPDIGPFPGAIAAAIRELAQVHHVDLINLSVGDYPQQSVAITNAIDDAWDAGTLVIAAAGNSGGRLQFPASHPRVTAIGALGELGVAPRGSYAYLNDLTARKPTQAGRYVCAFSPEGTNIFAIAPGTAIVIDVNGQGPFDLFGSSFSAPLAVSCLAETLGNDAGYQALSSRQRSQRARKVLETISKRLGFIVTLEGHGVPAANGSPDSDEFATVI